MNTIENAQKITLFKMNIVKECKKRNMRIPSDEQISEYIDSGYSLKLEDFMHDYTHFEGVFRVPHIPTPLEKATLDATLKLENSQLVTLYNTYLEESACNYMEYIFDLDNSEDVEWLRVNVPQPTFFDISKVVTDEGNRFVKVKHNDGKLTIKRVMDIKGLISGLWADIFTRIMLFPQNYTLDFRYFENTFVPIMTSMLGYKLDYQTCEVEYTENN